MPSCTFIYKPKSSDVTEILSTLIGYQTSHEDIKQKMVVAETEPKSVCRTNMCKEQYTYQVNHDRSPF